MSDSLDRVVVVAVDTTTVGPAADEDVDCRTRPWLVFVLAPSIFRVSRARIKNNSTSPFVVVDCTRSALRHDDSLHFRAAK